MSPTSVPLGDWLDLVRTDARSPKVVALLERFGASIDKVSWTHGTGSAALKAAGVHLVLWKPGSGKAAPVEVVGVDFCFSGMRGGTNYTGPAPFGIAAGDTLDQVRDKLAPLNIELWRDGRSATAHEEAQRYTAIFDARGRLTRFMVLAEFQMRRVPPSSSLLPA